VLTNAKDHPSAQEVYEKVRDLLPHITRGTIYNTLNRLVECGFVRALAFPGGARYDANLTSHINMVCTACGAIFDILGHEDEIRLLKRELSRASNFDIVSERLDFYGTCIECREKLVSD
jgi:Fur family peroxide stress response transcriptional regulator